MLDPMEGTQYRTRGLMGVGNYASVYEVEHVDLRSLFVAKIANARVTEDARALDWFMSEARITAAVQHPHLVKVVNFGWTADGRPYLVMERLVGKTLADELKAHRRLPLVEILHWLRQALGALGEAHKSGIVHRDLKPENLFLRELPDGSRVIVVLDCGLAKILEHVAGAPEPREFPTEEGRWVGTPRYAAPEQAHGLEVDGRTDIYALALVAYEALAGCGPFDDKKKSLEILEAQVLVPPDPPSQHARGIPRALDRAILKALAKKPEDRYQSADDFAAALEKVEASLGPLLSLPIVLSSSLVTGVLTYGLLKHWLLSP